MFQDSDIAKWLEAVGHSLMTHPDPELEKTADAMIDNQRSTMSVVTLDTYFIIKKAEERFGQPM